jgi:hypothetical protein
MDPDATQNFYSGLSLALLIGGTYNSGTPRYRQGPDKAAAFASSCSGVIGQHRCNTTTDFRFLLICNFDGFRDTFTTSGFEPGLIAEVSHSSTVPV